MDRGIIHSDQVGALTSPGLQLIYETAPIGLAFLSTDCRYVLINQHLTEICGISVAQHIGRTVRETVPDLAEQVENIVQIVLRTGEPVVGIEVNGQRPDKQNAERFWTTNWHPLKSPAGMVVGVSVVAEEITERKRAEAALRELNETLEQRIEEEAQERMQIWNVCQDFLVICDLEGKFLKVNPAWTATLGWHESELLGKSSQWMIHPDDREQALVETENLAAGRILNRSDYVSARRMAATAGFRGEQYPTRVESTQWPGTKRNKSMLRTACGKLSKSLRGCRGRRPSER